MKSFGVTWFIILLDKSTVIKDGLIGSPLNKTNFLFEFTVPIFRFFVFENLSKLCSEPWLFSGTRRNSFRVGVFWFGTSWCFPFYMFQLVPKQSFDSASRLSWALEITKKRGIVLANCGRENWFDLTWDQALFSFRFKNYIPADKENEKRAPILAVPVRENVWEPLKLGLISG